MHVSQLVPAGKLLIVRSAASEVICAYAAGTQVDQTFPDDCEVALQDVPTGHSVDWRAAMAKASLAATDGPTVRIVEDLVGILIAKGLIQEADLPQPARDRMAARAAERAFL